LLQWQLITLYNVPWISYFTAPHKHPPAALRELPWFASIWVLPFIKEYNLSPHPIVTGYFPNAALKMLPASRHFNKITLNRQEFSFSPASRIESSKILEEFMKI
jgi:hypothetical protein